MTRLQRIEAFETHIRKLEEATAKSEVSKRSVLFLSCKFIFLFQAEEKKHKLYNSMTVRESFLALLTKLSKQGVIDYATK